VLGGNTSYAGQSLDPNSVEVYINGKKLTVIKDWTFNSNTNTLTLNTLSANVGDALAISVTKFADFLIYDSQIKFNVGANVSPGTYATVTTYTDHDLNLMHREVYTGLTSNYFNLHRVVKNENYVWIDINKTPLLPVIDYRVEDNGRSLVLSNSIVISPLDTVVVTSISSDTSIDSIAFRQTKNVYQNNLYFRLSSDDAARLTQPLLPNDTIIYVDNVNLFKISGSTQSGMINIAGEKIIYREITDVGLTGLIRAVEGTGLRDLYPIGTKLFSTNNAQAIPYSDGRILQTAYTTNQITAVLAQASGPTLTHTVTLVSVMNLSVGMKSTHTVGNTVLVNTIEQINGHDVVLSSAVSNLSAGSSIVFFSDTISVSKIALKPEFNLTNDGKNENRVTVTLGGKQLQKPTSATNPLIKHDFNIALNSGEKNSAGVVSDVLVAPDYTISYDSDTGIYYLNILQTALPKDNTGAPIVGVEIKILKIIGKTWYTLGSTNSLQADSTVQAVFLQTAPAEVPDKYYYGKQ
jgi:hypothetical protein